MKRLTPTALAAVFLLVGLLASPPAPAAKQLTFGDVGAPGSLFAISAEEFARRANPELAPKGYKIVVFNASQLGSDTEMMQKVKLGTLDFSLPSTVMSSIVPQFGIFEMPYLVKSRAEMKQIDKEVVWPTLAPAAEKAGYKIVAVWENGFRQITNNVRPIYKPSDLKGIKLRTPKGKWRVKMFEAYGANPSPMALSEVFAALQTGTMDGEENPLVQIYSQKFQEVQKYLSMTDHVYTPAYVVTSVRTWNSLPPDVREIISKTAQATQAFVYKTAARMDKELLGKLKAAGMKVNYADKAAFVAASKPIYDEFAKEVPGGREMIDKILALGKK